MMLRMIKKGKHKISEKVEAYYTKKLLKAVENNNPIKVKKYLKHGANPNAKYESGDTVLHLASQNAFLNIIELLATHPQIELSTTDTQKLRKQINTIKLTILLNGSFDTNEAMDLIRLGADPTVKDGNGNTILHILSTNENNVGGRNNAAIEELVKVFNVDINIHNASGRTPLQNLMNNFFKTNAALQLIRLGADPTVKDKNGNTLLHILSKDQNNVGGRNKAAIEELVKVYNVDINIHNVLGRTPLQDLINSPFDASGAMDLIRLGADPTVKNTNGDTLLHILSTNENNVGGRYNAEIEELVKEFNVNINIHNASGRTPLQSLMNTSFKTNAAMDLIRLGADPTVKNTNGDTLLHILSADQNNVDGRNNAAIEELVKVFDVDINIHNVLGRTPLQDLINSPFDANGAMDLIRLGADPTVENTNGDTLLHVLSKHHNNSGGRYNAAIRKLRECVAAVSSCTSFLQVIRVLDKKHPGLKNLFPEPILCHIFSYLYPFNNMQKESYFEKKTNEKVRLFIQENSLFRHNATDINNNNNNSSGYTRRNPISK